MDINEIKSQMKKKSKSKKEQKITPGMFLSTGSTLVNLACTNRPEGGFVKGNYFFFVGDSASGKTWLSLTCFAEANINSHFDDYRFIYDNGEARSKLIDLERYFGAQTTERIEPPCWEGDKESASETVQEFYYNLKAALEEDQPCIYVLDSENSLTSQGEKKKGDEARKAFEQGKETAGSYGDGKAKVHSEQLRQMMRPLEDTGSILVMISQTRDNINPMSFETKTRSGGRALRFYAALEMWTAVKSKIYKTVKGTKRQIGINVEVRIKKNSITGRERSVVIPIYNGHGIDDVGSCVDYLLTEKHWSKSGQKIADRKSVV